VNRFDRLGELGRKLFDLGDGVAHDIVGVDIERVESASGDDLIPKVVVDVEDAAVWEILRERSVPGLAFRELPFALFPFGDVGDEPL